MVEFRSALDFDGVIVSDFYALFRDTDKCNNYY